MRYLFLGDGRLSKHLSFYLNKEGAQTSVWSRRSEKDLASVVQEKDILCLGFADKDLSTWAINLRRLFPRHPIVHFSGSAQIPNTLSFHPMMSFGPELYSLSEYRQIPFIGSFGQSPLRDVFPKLKNSYFEISSEKRSHYHALISMAANFPQLLYRELSKELGPSTGLSFETLAPLLRRSLENSLIDPMHAPTGPIERGDHKTISKHLDSLDSPQLKNIYFAFLNLNRSLIHENLKESPL